MLDFILSRSAAILYTVAVVGLIVMLTGVKTEVAVVAYLLGWVMFHDGVAIQRAMQKHQRRRNTD